jgi:hypothetical protein
VLVLALRDDATISCGCFRRSTGVVVYAGQAEQGREITLRAGIFDGFAQEQLGGFGLTKLE